LNTSVDLKISIHDLNRIFNPDSFNPNGSAANKLYSSPGKHRSGMSTYYTPKTGSRRGTPNRYDNNQIIFNAAPISGINESSSIGPIIESSFIQNPLRLSGALPPYTSPVKYRIEK